MVHNASLVAPASRATAELLIDTYWSSGVFAAIAAIGSIAWVIAMLAAIGSIAWVIAMLAAAVAVTRPERRRIAAIVAIISFPIGGWAETNFILPSPSHVPLSWWLVTAGLAVAMFLASRLSPAPTLLALSGLFFGATHVPPTGPLGALCFLAAAVLIEIGRGREPSLAAEEGETPLTRRRRLAPVCLFFFALALSPVKGLASPATGTATTAFVGVHVVPMDAERVLRDQTVVVSGGRIEAVGPADRTTIPKGARVVRAAGQYLVPGLADMHVHVYAAEELTLYVVNGVTTIFNLNGRPAHLSWRKRIAAGELLGPALYSAGPAFNRRRMPEEAVVEVDRESAAGYDAVKIYNEVSAAEYPALTAEAKRKNLVLVGHVAREPGLAGTLAAGQSIAHAEEYVYTFFNDDPDPANEVVHPLDTMKIPKAVALTREAGVSVIPTLVAFHNIVRQAMALPEYLRNPDLAFLPPLLQQQLEPDRNTYTKRFSRDRLAGLAVSYEFQRQLVRALHEGGVPILSGTDASWLGVPGFSLIEEIENFQALGFTPFEALKAATVDCARFLRRQDEFGTIAPGKRADFLLTRRNPLKDVRNLRAIAGVMARGRWIPDPERRRLLASLPASYSDTVARLTRQAESDLPGLDAYLGSNDPLGLLSSAVLSRLSAAGGSARVVAVLRCVHETNPGSQLADEEAVNQLGYQLLADRQPDAAIEVFRLNTEIYPKSGNACDSLAETYLGLGRKDLARQYYTTALEIQPDYPNARSARQLLDTTLK